MEKQQAIDLLDNLIGMIEDNQDNDYDTAFRMAIDALKAQLSQEGTTSDTISRQAAIDALDVGAEFLRKVLDVVDLVGAEREKYEWGLGLIEACIVDVKELPPAQPEPKVGRWIKHETPDGGEQYECSRCGVLWEFNDGSPEDNEAYFCPKCGADMRGDDKK